jgi:hypothetical protein
MPQSPITADNRKKNAKKEHQLKLFFTQHQLNVVHDTNLTLWILL